MNTTCRPLWLLLGLACAALPAAAADWLMWGGDPSRNMVSSEKNLPDSFNPGKVKGELEDVDLTAAKNIRWVFKLGTQSYGNPVIAGGKLYIGTNNESPRDPKYKGDRGILMCIDEKTGKFLWQLSVPKLGTGKVSDWEFLGICSSAAVEGNRLYILSSRCEVLCLDTEGLTNGNDGPYKEEAAYTAGPGKPPVEQGPQDADIIWRFDMREEVGVFPHNITAGSPVIFGDKIVVTTSNGVDWTHTKIPNPNAPGLIMLDKKTGALLGEEKEGVSARTLHSNWSSPAFGVAGGRKSIIFGAGDGWCYGLDPDGVKDDNGLKILNLLWKYDCNPPDYRIKDGQPIKYATANGPSEVIATPVFYKGRVYAAVGQDPEHGDGIGNLACIDITKSGDISRSGTIWSYDKIARSLSTASIADGLLFIADFSGVIHCLDAETGQPYWTHDTLSHIWGSTLVADGKVFIGTEDGDLFILAADKKLKEINKVNMGAPVYSSTVASNGTLYVATPTHLYAIAKMGK